MHFSSKRLDLDGAVAIENLTQNVLRLVNTRRVTSKHGVSIYMVLEVTRLRSLEVVLRRLVLDVVNGEWRDMHVAHEAILRTVFVEVDSFGVF